MYPKYDKKTKFYYLKILESSYLAQRSNSKFFEIDRWSQLKQLYLNGWETENGYTDSADIYVRPNFYTKQEFL